MARLHDYKQELLKTHPSSTIIVNCNDEGVFEALYVYLSPIREGISVVGISFLWIDAS